MPVDVVDDPACLRLIEQFAFTVHGKLPFVTLKMAMSLDGYVASAPQAERVTGDAAQRLVFELRAEHDAVMVGAGTVRVDDPQLTVRPHRTRRKPYARVVVCETTPIPLDSRVVQPPADAPPASYRPTIALAPAGRRAAFTPLSSLAEVLFVGEPTADVLDLRAGLEALRGAGISSVLCEGGPTLAGRLIAAGLVERIVWLVAPRFFRSDRSLPVLAGAELAGRANGWSFERVERLGDDLMVTARLPHV